ncbi:hypothetical protein M8C21_027696 [Ambrosia artemisiifolia]|uniref:Uncharacterized protein n=1 Tax=Ambrosia artemisiifolia TaxID=4212 RepID=A0AAD5CJC5_AMBAR|nr:hypothetical protein M8C21_027696 [Ambrosia artemisiifolia]
MDTLRDGLSVSYKVIYIPSFRGLRRDFHIKKRAAIAGDKHGTNEHKFRDEIEDWFSDTNLYIQ